MSIGAGRRQTPNREVEAGGKRTVWLNQCLTTIAPYKGWGEGVTGHRETLTPHPTPLPMGEGADRACLESVDRYEDCTFAPATGRGDQRERRKPQPGSFHAPVLDCGRSAVARRRGAASDHLGGAAGNCADPSRSPPVRDRDR